MLLLNTETIFLNNKCLIINRIKPETITPLCYGIFSLTYIKSVSYHLCMLWYIFTDLFSRRQVTLAILQLHERGALNKLTQTWWYDKGQCSNDGGVGHDSIY